VRCTVHYHCFDLVHVNSAERKSAQHLNFQQQRHCNTHSAPARASNVVDRVRSYAVCCCCPSICDVPLQYLASNRPVVLARFGPPLLTRDTTESVSVHPHFLHPLPSPCNGGQPCVQLTFVIPLSSNVSHQLSPPLLRSAVAEACPLPVERAPCVPYCNILFFRPPLH
jgi:hypothetical protein